MKDIHDEKNTVNLQGLMNGCWNGGNHIHDSAYPGNGTENVLVNDHYDIDDLETRDS